MKTIVAVVGIMLTREVVVRAKSSEDAERQIRALLVNLDSGEWKLSEFEVGEASLKLAIVAPTDQRATA